MYFAFLLNIITKAIFERIYRIIHSTEKLVLKWTISYGRLYHIIKGILKKKQWERKSLPINSVRKLINNLKKAFI